MASIIVIGSSNTDMVIKSKRLPSPGETILGGSFLMNPGGKGANQAVAAARLGGKVIFITKTGNDIFGQKAKELFNKENISTDYIVNDENNPSGVALITVDEWGENSIVVASGSNGTLSASEISNEIYTTEKNDIFLMQLEIPLSTVEAVAEKAASSGNRVILNPAPAAVLSDDLLKCLFLITPNATEAEVLTGIKVTDTSTAAKAAMELHRKGVKNVIVTMGGSGAFLSTQSVTKLIPVEPVKAVDTTAAGDVFNGALAVAVSEGKELPDAVVFANKAAGISVTRMGAQASAPYRNEIVL
jgi:ribokinase